MKDAWTGLGRLAILLACLFASAPLLAQWRVAETANFRLHGQLSERDLRARALLLEDFHALLERATGRSLPQGAPPLDVYLVERIVDASPWRRMGPNVAGFYRADSNRISAVALEEVEGSRSRDAAQMLLLHEYAHHFMLGASRAAYPAWYVEGFAEYFSTARFRPDRIEYGEASANRATALARFAWIPLERLLARDPSLMAGSNARMFYAQSWLLTHYMFRAPGMREKLQAYLKAYATGEDPVEAFRRTVDPDLAAFQARLQTYVRREATYSRFDRPPPAPADVRVLELPAAADSLLLPVVALEHGVPAAERAAAMADIRARIAASPADPEARRALALAELRLGSPAEAAAQLDLLLNQAPRDAELLRWKAEALRAQGAGGGREAEARRLLVRAAAVAPDDWRILHAYARLYRRPAVPMPPSVLDTLLRAYALAPQVAEVVLDTGLALSNAGRLEEAARVLEPLAWAPHQSRASELARRMLVQAKRGDRTAVQKEVALHLRGRQAADAGAADPAS